MKEREDIHREDRAKKYDDLMSPLEFRVLSVVVEELIASRNNRSLKVVDLCCGTGLLAGMLGGTPGIRYTGVDMDARFLAAARRRVRHRPDFTFVKADVMTYGSELSYDAALMTFGFHHLEDTRKERFLKHVQGLIQDRGVFIVGDYVIPPYETEDEFKKAVTDFYARRVSYLEKHRLVSDTYINEIKKFCVSSAVHEEFKLDYRRTVDTFERSGFEKLKEIKTWPDADVYGHELVGDYVFIFRRK